MDDSFIIKQDFPYELRLKLKRENGLYCKLCSEQIVNERHKYIDQNNIFEVHHLIPKRKGGKGVKSNALVCCAECHTKLHKFIDIFKIDQHDFRFFTTVYIHLFLPLQQNKIIYQDFPLYTYANSLNDLARQFRNKVKDMPLVHYMLLQYYMYYTGHYYNPIMANFISTSFSYNRLSYQTNKSSFKMDYLNYIDIYRDLIKAA